MTPTQKPAKAHPRPDRPNERQMSEMGLYETFEGNLLKVDLGDWQVALETTCAQQPRSSVEQRDGFTLVHFDLPQGPLGDYQIILHQPMIDIHRTWTGQIESWRGRELASIGLEFSFETCVTKHMPVLCNYNRFGKNRGISGMLDHVPVTHVRQRALTEGRSMGCLRTRFSRSREAGGFRETVVIGRQPEHFAQVVQQFMNLCRHQQRIEPLVAPDWAREPVWCSWYSHLYHLTQQDVEAQIPYLRELGIRTVLVDASWFKAADDPLSWVWGDYRPNLDTFPDLAGLSRKIHEAGLKLMLWCSPVHVGNHAAAADATAHHRMLRDGQRLSKHCPFHEDTQQYMRALLERLMCDYELDGLKLDFMSGDMQGCEDPAHDHGDGQFAVAYMDNLAQIRDAILAVRPEAAIEFRLSYSTLATLPLANCHRGNDAPYDADYIRRENQFLRLFCGAPSAIWSDYAFWHPSESSENVARLLGMQIFSGGVPTLSVDLAKRTAAHREVIGTWLAFYNTHRTTLAHARLKVHSADSTFTVASLQSDEQGVAYLLLAGQHIPAHVDLGPGIREAWILNASAERSGRLAVSAGGAAKGAIDLADLEPVHVVIGG